MDQKTRQWLKAVDDRRKTARDRRQQEATYFANKIRAEIERVEIEWLAATATRDDLLSRADEKHYAAAWDATAGDLNAELRGLRRALRLIMGVTK